MTHSLIIVLKIYYSVPKMSELTAMQKPRSTMQTINIIPYLRSIIFTLLFHHDRIIQLLSLHALYKQITKALS